MSVWGAEQGFSTIPPFLVTALPQGSDVRRRAQAQTIRYPLQGLDCLPRQTRGDPDLLRITLAAAMKILLPIHRLPRSPSHPCPRTPTNVPNRCSLKPLTPETTEETLLLVLPQRRLALQVVWRSLP